MKTVTRLAIASLMMVLGLAGWSHAQDPVSDLPRQHLDREGYRAYDRRRSNARCDSRKRFHYNGGSSTGALVPLIMEYVGDNTGNGSNDDPGRHL